MANANMVMNDMVINDMEILRDKLSRLIQTKNELVSPEVLKTSILLDKALNHYNSQIFKELMRDLKPEHEE